LKKNMEILYTAVATATGGREGQVKSSDGVLDLQVRLPKALGGSAEGFTNPEQLFAAGYSVCFDNALNKVIRREKVKTGPTSVTAAVGIGKIGDDRFGLAVTLTANIPGVTTEEAKALIEKAHLVCPYSNATRGNIDVRLEVTTIDR
jgi:osmotically inducible protein OsmC